MGLPYLLYAANKAPLFLYGTMVRMQILAQWCPLKPYGGLRLEAVQCQAQLAETADSDEDQGRDWI